MPKGSSKTRFDNIAKENAKVTIEEVNYDECVRIAAAEAASVEHGVIVQDTAWEGYTEIPSWIMQGYATMGSEALDQLNEYGVERPDVVILQAGVGCMAGAICAYIVNRYKENPPKIVIAEAAIADCLYQGAVANDGKYRIVDGDLQTIMAGLACGEPNIVCWEILRDHVAAFCSCPDWMSAKGMRMLAAPIKGDPAVCSGESGAVGMGLIATLMQDPDYAELKEALELNENSKVLLFSTEGDTDPDKYKSIVWGGEYATV
jgi:diaminopropionate ammonia-lyase